MLSLFIHLERDSGAPLHHQVAAALRRQIEEGQLEAGRRLPASRDLAGQLGVNRGTVQKAFDTLVQEGLLRARVGQGTFVNSARRSAGAVTSSPGEPPFAFELRDVEDAAWERLGRWSARAGMINFAGGVPDARLFPMEPFRACLNAALDEEGAALLQYGASRGYPPFLEFLAGHLSERGLPAAAEGLLVVSGSQQGLDLIGRALIAPGDAVVVEEPTYSGALALFRLLGARLLPVPVDAEGMNVDHLAGIMAHERPKLIYSIPTFHNPTGVTMSTSRRLRLLEICAAQGVPLVEDDSDGELRFEGEDVPPLAAMPAAQGVIYMGTFSKLFFPGLRLGWVAAAPAVLRHLEATKRVTDLHTAPLLQAAMTRFAASRGRGRLAGQVCARYRARRDAMLAALTEQMPEGVSWTRPQGGLSLMVDLPEDLDATDLLNRAVEAGVVFAPGNLFSARGGRSSRLRLTYGNVEETEIETGVGHLAQAVKDEIRGAAGRRAGKWTAGTPLPV